MDKTIEPTKAAAAKTYANLKKKEEKRNEVEYEAEIPLEALKLYTERAVIEAAQNLEMPGFRKGKVPANIAREQMDEMALLEEAADQALRVAVREMVRDEKLDLASSPRLTITKIAIGNPVEFKVRFALYPEVKLPDYKKIGNEIATRVDPTPEVTEADMNEAITRLLAMIAMQSPELDTDKEKKPELTDEMVKKFGPFKDVADFKEKLKENLGRDKVINAKEAKREEIMRAVVSAAKVEIPAMLIDEEYYAFEDQREESLKQAGVSLEDYLKQTKQDEKELEKNERKLIEERVKTSMVFREIQKAEAIEPSEKEIQTNIAYLKLQYKDRDEQWLRQTSEALLIQEKIFAVFGLPLREAEAEIEGK